MFMTPALMAFVLAATPMEFHFENDIVPLLGRYGCNSSGCHGKAEGQNGFKLSVFGSDPEADYATLIKEGRGRRIFPAAPERSLLLLKASGQMPHGGGNRMPAGSIAYQRIRNWIAAGAPIGRADAPKVVAVRVEPTLQVMKFRQDLPLRVFARYSDQREIEVTAEARFQTNRETIAVVDATGKITTLDVPGEAVIMASFLNETAMTQVIIPRPENDPYPNLPVYNFIDPLVDAKLKKLNITPAPLCGDAEFLRRVSLDVMGTLPTATEVRTFLADTRADKRSRWVDACLERSEYVDYWALKWSDVLRVDRGVLGHRRAYAYYRWIRESIARNQPHDAFARELITAEGPLEENGAANFYRVLPKAGEAASAISQVFLGVRMACAECHHHPYDRWSQGDYYGMQAFFTPVSVQKFGDLEAVIAQGEPVTTHPRTGAKIEPTTLLGQPLTLKGDRRPALATWLTSTDNPYFARHLANRYWAHFLGRGIVDPVDDVRATNPPSNPELLDALAKSVIDSKFDRKALIRTITASRTYQLASQANASNERDEQNASRALLKRIDAEVLLDMISQTTGTNEKFLGVAPGSRAIQLWDSKVNHYFLTQFGRPQRLSACECERNAEPNVAQVLHLLNSPEIHGKLSHDGGTIARWVRTIGSDVALVEEMYLTFFSRLPSPDEKNIGVEFLASRPSDKRRQAAEDLAWAMLNSTEFLFNH